MGKYEFEWKQILYILPYFCAWNRAVGLSFMMCPIGAEFPETPISPEGYNMFITTSEVGSEFFLLEFGFPQALHLQSTVYTVHWR